MKLRIKLQILFVIVLVIILVACLIGLILIRKEKFENENDDIQIYIISLLNSKDRREKISREFNRNFNFFDAVDGKNIPAELNSYQVTDLLNPGEIGCYLSHITLWKHLLDVNKFNKPILILEDDAKITGDLSIINRLPKDYDIVFLGYCFEKVGEKIDDNIFICNDALCLHGYIISEKGINKLLNLLENQKLDAAIDERISEFIINKKIIAYIVKPAEVGTNGSESTINRNKGDYDYREKRTKYKKELEIKN